MRARRRLVPLLLLPLFLLGVGQARCPHPNVLVIGLDGGTWAVMDPLMQAGYLPNFARIVAHSARGDLSCTEAFPQFACFCPPVWNSIFTGVTAAEHGIGSLDQNSTDRRRKPIWSVLHAYGLTTTGLSLRTTWPTEPDMALDFNEQGLDAASREIYERWGDLPDPREAFEQFRTGPPGMFEALGMLPHVGDRVPVWSMFARDRVALEALRRVVGVARTDLTFIVLHGPDKIEHLIWSAIQPIQFGPIDESALLDMAARYTGPTVGPPPWAFGSLSAQYQEADAWLGQFLRRNHYDYIMLVSDHGMGRRLIGGGLTGDHGLLNPEAHLGIFALAGPGIHEGPISAPITVLDVAPTLAYLLGVPIGQDLPGRVIQQAFTARWWLRHRPETVASWEALPQG